LISSLKLNFEVSWSDSETKEKVEKIEKLSNILKESCYYLNVSILQYAKIHGDEPYLYYSSKVPHRKI